MEEKNKCVFFFHFLTSSTVEDDGTWPEERCQLSKPGRKYWSKNVYNWKDKWTIQSEKETKGSYNY